MSVAEVPYGDPDRRPEARGIEDLKREASKT
jgi:hypothetical protein